MNTCNMSNDFIEDLVWMASRYCIGRHSIAACTMPHEIITNLDFDGELFTEKYITDIRREINNQLKWNEQIKIVGNDVGEKDVAYILGCFLASSEIEDPNEYQYEIDLNTETVVAEPYQYTNYFNLKITNLLDDLLPWSKMANALSKSEYKTIKTQYNESFEVFEYIERIYGGNGIRYEKLKCDWDSYKKCPGKSIFINEK